MSRAAFERVTFRNGAGPPTLLLGSWPQTHATMHPCTHASMHPCVRAGGRACGPAGLRACLPACPPTMSAAGGGVAPAPTATRGCGTSRAANVSSAEGSANGALGRGTVAKEAQHSNTRVFDKSLFQGAVSKELCKSTGHSWSPSLGASPLLSGWRAHAWMGESLKGEGRIGTGQRQKFSKCCRKTSKFHRNSSRQLGCQM